MLLLVVAVAVADTTCGCGYYLWVRILLMGAAVTVQTLYNQTLERTRPLDRPDLIFLYV